MNFCERTELIFVLSLLFMMKAYIDSPGKLLAKIFITAPIFRICIVWMFQTPTSVWYGYHLQIYHNSSNNIKAIDTIPINITVIRL